MVSGYALVQIPDFLEFLYESYRKLLRSENDSEKKGTRIVVASLEDDAEEQLSDDTQGKNCPQDISNQSESLESLDGRSGDSTPGDVKPKQKPKPSRLPIYMRHHKVNSTHVGAR